MDENAVPIEARQAVVAELAAQRSGWLELFFTSVGLGTAYARPSPGWGREKRIAAALAEADGQGRLAEVIRLAEARLRGVKAPPGPWPPRRIRYELNLLLHELDGWTQGWRTAEIVDAAVERFNRVLDALRQHDPSGAVPDPFELQRADYSGTGNTVKEPSFARFRETVRETIGLVPEDDLRARPRPADAAVSWHPLIRDASAALFLDGHYSSAALEAFKAVETRVRTLAGVDSDITNMGQIFDEQKPVLRLNGLGTRSEVDMQRGYKLLFIGAMAGIRNPLAHEQATTLEAAEAAELLAVASLLMRRLDEAERLRAAAEPGEVD